MFGLELWFMLAIVSACTGGFFIFITKVVAERNYDILLLSAVSPVLAGTLFLLVTFFVSDFSGISSYVLLMVVINALTYVWVNLLRHTAMQCIDTAIYYPIYKTLTPALVIVLGVVLFKEQFSQLEWLGLGASLMVPLLLISRSEKSRQRDLFKGLKLLMIAAILATIAAVVMKEGTTATDNIWFFVTLTDFGIAIAAIVLLILRHKKRVN